MRTQAELSAAIDEALRQSLLLIKQKGLAVYQTFTENERTAVRFGLLPAAKVNQAFAELLALREDLAVFQDHTDVARLLALAIMDAANAGPDPLVV